MKHFSIALIAALLAGPAFALSLVPENVNTNTNTPVASANQGQNQNQGQAQGQLQGQAQLQGQGQGQGQGQAQGLINTQNFDVKSNSRSNADAFSDSNSKSGAASDASAKSNSGGNVQQTIVTDSGQVRYSGSYDVRNVPSIVGGTIYPTAPCMGSSQVGGAGVGFGFSVGTTWKDDECGVRETARSFQQMGLGSDALAILCSSQYAGNAPSCAKVNPLVPPATNKPEAAAITTNHGCYTDPIVAGRMGKPVCK
jgi:hypothetical protein